MNTSRWLGLTLSLLALSISAWAQDGTMTARPAPRAASARREGNILRVNGKATVLLWATGLTDPEDLDTYAEAGFNTVAVPVTDTSADALTQAFALASAAEEKGMYLVGVLAPEQMSDADGNQVETDPLLEAYLDAVNAFVDKAVEGLSRHPRLLAWVAAVRPETVVWGDRGFQVWLADAYPTIRALNESWGTEFGDFSEITAAGVRDLDGGRVGGVGRASVDFAAYREKTYVGAVEVWTRALRAKESQRLLFAGGITDYRSAIGLTRGLDGLVMETTTTRAESDYATANVQAVDVARRGNRLVAVQTLDLSTGPAAMNVRNWINLALLHGASGIQLAGWPELEDDAALTATVKAAAEMLATSTVFPMKPKARAALLYEPYAGGAMARGQSLYGYLDGLTEREPTALFFTVRNGSRYGLMDVLSLDDLMQAELDSYGAIFAPMAFYLPDKAQSKLHQFALEGGLLVADAGVGMYQGTGVIGSLPDILRETFGLKENLTPADETTTDGSEGNPNVHLPEGSGRPMPGIRGQDADLARAQQSTEALIRELYSLLEEPDVSKTLNLEYGAADGPGIRSRKVGKGIAVYAPAFLYEQWGADRDDYAAFHDRVLGWRADLRVSEPDDLWPSVEASSAGTGITVVTPGDVPAAVRFYGETNELYAVPNGAVRVWEPSLEEPVELLFPGAPVATARPLPIWVTPLDEGSQATVIVHRYDGQEVDLEVHGAESQARPGGGMVVLQGGVATNVEVSLESGAFPIKAGQSYHVVVTDGGRPLAEYDAMPDQGGKTLTLRYRLRSGRMVIAPAG